MTLAHEVVCRRVGPAEHLAREQVDCLPGAIRLHMTATGTRAHARCAVGDDHHVAELGPRAVQTARGDHASTDAGPEREDEHVARAAAGAERVLGERRAARVVLDLDGQVEPPLHLVAKRDVAHGDVDRGPDCHAALRIDTRRDPEADGLDAVERQLAHDLGELVEQRGLGHRRRRAVDDRNDAPVGLDETGADLGPADVDADHTVGRHLAWVP